MTSDEYRETLDTLGLTQGIDVLNALPNPFMQVRFPPRPKPKPTRKPR